MKNKKKILIGLEKLKMKDQESNSGCTVVLGEWLDKENIEILAEYIKEKIEENLMKVIENVNKKKPWELVSDVCDDYEEETKKIIKNIS